LTSVGRLRIERDHEIPNAVAGSSHWTGQEWLVCLNGNHPARRQRFTAFHELHHIIEHQVQRFENSTSAERLADHFSACVLMPRTAVKRAWCSGLQDIRRLADLFEVSEPAMRTRLVKLGLLDPSRHSCRRGRRRHHQPGWSHPFGTPGTEAQASTCGGSR
jgi:Zn-dependent peptidase ImmA (M78 family)